MTVAAMVVAVVALALTLAPLWREEERAGLPPNRAALLRERKATLLEAIRDLDFEHATGKLGVEDHSELRQDLVGQAAEVVKELDAVGAAEDADAFIEARIGERRARLGQPRQSAGERCSKCDGELRVGAEFCSSCGAARLAVCSSCGQGLREGDQFCARCGEGVEGA